MNAIRFLIAQAWVGRLGWTLVHFLWHGLAIAAVYAGGRAFAKDASPNRRYLLACAALTAMLAAPIVTYALLSSPEPVSPISAPTAAASTADSGTIFPIVTYENATFAAVWTERVMPAVVMFWLAGTIVFWVRLAGGWMAAARLRTRLVYAAPGEWQQVLDGLAARLRIGRSVRLLVSGLVETPMVVGWLRPAVLVPIAALAGMPAEHLEALLSHELAHIRRHDYLVNMLQSIAEALLFYHPAVWWISGHIRAERELCCDDLAVAATGDAFGYAVALADLEACRPAHAHGALAANGGRLAERIARLLGKARPERQTFSASGAAGAVLLLAITACVVFGQAAERPKFEVASVKPTEADRHSSLMRPQPGGRLIAQNAATRLFITRAYQVQDFQVVGGPEWLRDEGFDLEAKAGGEATLEQLMVMLQSLLEERFHLKYHRENRELPVYALTLARGGAKLPAPKPDACVKVAPNVAIKPTETPCGNLNMSMQGGGLNLHGGEVAMKTLIKQLSSMLGRPVLDKTGVTATFDVSLKFTVDDTLAGLVKDWGTVQGHRESMMAASGTNDPHAAPTFLAAMQEQLGLKLESTKGPVEVMVIDHIEKPAAN
jgi:uncharacterized protein (TIGR03435 family)